MKVKGPIPVSVARREYLRAAVVVAFFLDIAGLAGAKRPFLPTNLEPVASAAFLAASTSVAKCKN